MTVVATVRESSRQHSIVTMSVSCTISEISASNNSMTLKSRLVQCHWKWRRSIDHIQVLLSVRHCNYGSILYRFRDKARYWPKIVPPAFDSPVWGRIPVGVLPYSLLWKSYNDVATDVEEVWWYTFCRFDRIPRCVIDRLTETDILRHIIARKSAELVDPKLFHNYHAHNICLEWRRNDTSREREELVMSWVEEISRWTIQALINHSPA